MRSESSAASAPSSRRTARCSGGGAGAATPPSRLAVMAAGLALSGSRSGVAIAGIGIVALLVARGTRARGRAAVLLFGAVLLVGVAVLRVSNGPGSAGERLGQIFDGRLPDRVPRVRAAGPLGERRATLRAAPGRRRGPRRVFVAAAQPARRAGPSGRDPRQPRQRVPAGARGDGSRRPPPDGGPGVRARARVVGGAARRGRAGRGGRQRRGGAGVPRRLAGGLALVRPRRRVSLLPARGRHGARAARRASALEPRRGAAAWRSTPPRRSSRRSARAGPTRPSATARRSAFTSASPDRAGPFRWTQRRFALRVEPGRTQRILLSHYTPEGRRVELTVEADDRGSPPARSSPASPSRCGSPPDAGGPRDFRFTLSRAFVPRRLGVSGDRRELGADRRVLRGADVEFQFHPASRQAAVRTVVLGPRGERVAIAAAGLAALLAVSPWITVPAVGLAASCAPSTRPRSPRPRPRSRRTIATSRHALPACASGRSTAATSSAARRFSTASRRRPGRAA